jgi:hypothetical protein
MVDKNMLDKLDHKMQVRFAVFCAKQVIDLVDAKYKEACLKAIEAAEGFVEGRVSKKECYTAGYAVSAGYAAHAAGYAGAAYAAAYAAGYAVSAAGYAVSAANAAAYAANAAVLARKDVEQEQIRYYNELLNFDKIVEEMIGL